MNIRTALFSLIVLAILALSSCGNDAPPMAPAVNTKDSIAMMVDYGVATLMSDSGYVKYKLVAEEWHFFNRNNKSLWVFPKGVFLERYDRKFNVDMHVTADTAYFRDQNLLELRGRVYLQDLEKQVTFTSEELFYDTQKHLFYSRMYHHFRTPDRDLKGDWFESDDQFRKYHVKQSRGFVPVPGNGEQKAIETSEIPSENESKRLEAVPTARKTNEVPLTAPDTTRVN